MKLTASNFKEIRDVFIEASINAGKIINRYKKNGFKLKENKMNNSIASSLLTEVDLKSQEIILEKVRPLITKYDLGLLAEEAEDDKSRLEKEYFICLDPLDGTKSFIYSNEGYSVSISLISKSGIPTVGVVYNPVEDILYSAIKGRGLYRNNQRWKPELTLSNKIIVDPGVNISLINNESNSDFVHYGGAVLNAIRILEGFADAYIKTPKLEKGGGSIWDFSSTTLFFKEADYWVSDFYKNDLNLNNRETTYMNKFGVYYSIDKNLSSNN